MAYLPTVGQCIYIFHTWMVWDRNETHLPSPIPSESPRSLSRAVVPLAPLRVLRPHRQGAERPEERGSPVTAGDGGRSEWGEAVNSNLASLSR